MWCPGDIVVRSRGELLASLLKTQSRHSAQRVVKKVLRMLAVLDSCEAAAVRLK